MKNFVLEQWDEGRLTVNGDYAGLLRHAQLLTFASIWDATAEAAAAKNIRPDRVTRRFELTGPDGVTTAYYIKRHPFTPWKEIVKPLLHLSWPSVGARPEWDALIAFHEAGLATMTPVALGVANGASFLITAALVDCDKLSECQPEAGSADRRDVVHEVAQLARRMHGSRLHHQDFYLGHLLRPREKGHPVHVIDLGRVQRHQSWTAQRWIVKDLAQLNFSAKTSHAAERLRFLREYLGRPLRRGDRSLMQQIARKTAKIARHTRKNDL